MMKNRVNYLVITLCAAIALVGCSIGQGRVVTNGNEKDATVKKEVKIGNFSKVNACNGIRVKFSQGKSSGVAKIATTPSAEPYVDVKVEDNELYVRYKSHKGTINGPTIVTVSAPQLEEVELSSAAAFIAEGNLSLKKDLELSMSSASSAEFNTLTCAGVDIELSSSASVRIKSVDCRKFDADLSSASSLSVGKAVATSIWADASSAASIEIGAALADKLTAEASSGAKVTVKGIDSVNVKGEATSGGNVTLSGRCANLDKDASSGGNVDVSRLANDGKKTQVKSSGERGVRIP